jgi:type II restriction enzyme
MTQRHKLFWTRVSFRMNVPVKLEGGVKTVNIPIDAVIMPKTAASGTLPIFFEAKSAGDFTNTNKRRKEEAMKMAQLRSTYGSTVRFNLFLCGYFDGGYLGYEATEGIDWAWEHRIDDLTLFGI